MKASVIIISYNEKEYLKNAIESCLNQRFDDSYEVIIGDDGSTDGSIELIKDYQEKYPDIIKTFIMDRDYEEGVSAVIPSLRVSNIIKKAFSIASGEYFTVLSGDDIICDLEKWKKQVDFLDNHENYNACYCDYKKFWNTGKEEVIKSPSGISNIEFWSLYYVHISCFMFRKNVTEYLLDRLCDDTGLIYSILRSGKCGYLPGVMFGYRQREDSIMHEADQFELNIIELLLFQDISNQKHFSMSSLSRFAKPLLYVFRNRKQLKNEKYKKYLLNCEQYSNNYLVLINEGVTLRSITLLSTSTIVYVWFRVIRKIRYILGMIGK